MGSFLPPETGDNLWAPNHPWSDGMVQRTSAQIAFSLILCYLNKRHCSQRKNYFIMDRLRPIVGASDNLLENKFCLSFLETALSKHAFCICRREAKKLQIGGNYVTQYYF